MCFPGGTNGKEPSCQCREVEEMWVQSLGWEDLLEEGTEIHSSILAWRIPWTEELAGYGPWGGKESGTTEVLQHAHRHPVIFLPGQGKWFRPTVP